MTRKRILQLLLVLLLVLLALGAIWIWQSTRPRLTVLVYGKPPQRATVISCSGLTPLSLDGDGNVVLPPGAVIPEQIMMECDDGNFVLSYPRRGHKTIDMRGSYSTTETVSLDLGFYQHRKRSEQFNLSDEEMAQVKNGEVSFEVIERRIREREDQKSVSN